MNAAEWVKKANGRLKGCGLTLEISGKNNNIYVRGMFPGKPWEPNSGRAQRRVALKIRAVEPKDVKLAEGIAREIALDLNRGEFDWRRFADIEDPTAPRPKTIADYVAEFEADRRPRVCDYTWLSSYETRLKTLPLNEELSEDILIDWILRNDPKATTSRPKYIAIARSLCELAGISDRRVKRLSRDVTAKAVNPRDLPKDERIEEIWQSIVDPEWQMVYGMLATYGLRPHELFRLDLSRFPDLRVLPNTKTGERLVPPLYPSWVEKFQLSRQFSLPANRLQWTEENPNWLLGSKISCAFNKRKLGKAYDLRHCYARRCLEAGLTSDVSAALMGHSRKVHEERYRAFIGSNVYIDTAKRMLLNQPDR